MVIREDVASRVSTKQTLEKSKLKVRDHELEIDLELFPAYPFWPGSFIEFGKEYWGSESYIYKKKYRVYEVNKLTGMAFRTIKSIILRLKWYL